MFDSRYAVYIDNRLHHGVPGFHVVMPLRLAGSDRYVLVNRGWIAQRGGLREVPSIRTPVGEVTVNGIAVVPSTRVVELSERVTEGRIWQNLMVERYRRAMPISIQPFVILQNSALDDGLVREWDPPISESKDTMATPSSGSASLQRSSSSMPSHSSDAAAPKRRSRLTLWLILAVCAAPLAAAYLAFYF